MESLAQRLCDAGFEDTVILSDEFDDAFTGVTTDGNAVYMYSKMVECLQSADGMTWEEAAEYIDYNTIRSLPYIPGCRPVIVNDFID